MKPPSFSHLNHANAFLILTEESENSVFFDYPSFPNTKIFNSAIYSSFVGYENCMTASGVAIISVM